jgi:hypothetical protein
MQKLISKLLPMVLLSGATAFAGSFTSDFSNPNQPGYTLNLFTDTSGNSYPVVTNSELLLMPDEVVLYPYLSVVLDDLDTNAAGGIVIDSFTATFDLQIGPSSSTPADGIAFVFGPDIVSSTAFSEAGPSMPSGGVSVGFVTYPGDYPGIGVCVKVMGDGADDPAGIPTGGFVPMSSGTMVDSQMHKVSIQVNRNGTLDLVWNGKTVFTNLFLTGWSPVYGQFAIGGRNGGDYEQVAISNLVINTVQEPATPAPPVVTSQPQSVTNLPEGTSATFSVGFDGDAPLSFQWTENGSPIPNGTNSVLVMTEVSYTNNNAQIACTITGPVASTNSKSVLLTVIPDTTPPKVASVNADLTFTNVTVTFSKPVSDTALVASNYKINQGVTVLSVTWDSQTTVTLATSPLPQKSTFILTINGVQDMAATPNTIAPNTQFSFLSFTFLSGTILHKVYYNCSADGSIADFLADPRYPNNPDRVDLATSWVWPPDGAGTDAADTNQSGFYDSLEGYFFPPADGDYVFYTCGDDEWYLYLSTNQNPVNMQLVAQETGGWAPYLQWESPVDYTEATAPNGSALSWNTASFAGTTWPTGNTISLTKGDSYYMIMFHHDHAWSGGDQFQETYEGPNDTNAPADGDASKLTGSVVGFDFNPAGSTIAFGQQPQSVSTVEGTSATFTVAATGTSPYGDTVTYQWQTAPQGSTTWTNIAGATTTSYSTLPLGLADNGTQYRCIASMAAINATSSVAIVTVVATTSPPVLTAGAMMGPTAGTINIGIGFNKTVEDATASLQANYSVSSGTITSFLWCSNRFTADSQNPLVEVRKQDALLTVSGFSSSGVGTVTVKNISDTLGNTLASTNIPFTVASNMSWGVVGADDLGTNNPPWWNAVVPVGSNAFDVYSDGIAEWGTYDETTFVYEQVTGDFDKKLRVEYQDGSSEWGRCGIIVRDVLNFGVDSALQTGSGKTNAPYDGLAGRYQKCHVNPVGLCLTAAQTTPSFVGAKGNASWEGNRRLDTGSACTTCLTNTNATPLYPNAWCRIQRRGQTFTIFRSADGTNWEQLGLTTWGTTNGALSSNGGPETTNAMPDTVYVGPEFSPENGNITLAADRGTFLGQFRDYGDYVAPATQPTITASSLANGTFTITYTGTLQSSPNIAGPYTAVSGATSPYTVNPKTTGTTMFYRAGP